MTPVCTRAAAPRFVARRLLLARSHAEVPPPRGLHSFTLELSLSNFRTHSRVKVGYTVDRRAQVELKWEQV